MSDTDIVDGIVQVLLIPALLLLVPLIGAAIQEWRQDR